MMSALTVGLAVTGALAARAEGDPHLTVATYSGDFVLHAFGALKDGTPCPPSTNSLAFAFDHEGTVIYAHFVTLSPSADPVFAKAFAKGSFCAIEFSGQVTIRTHHGSQATILPDSVGEVQGSVALQRSDRADHSGRLTIEYHPIMCFRAPCPPGVYGIADAAGRRIARVGAIAVTDAAGRHWRLAGRYPDFRIIEGRLWIGPDGKTARLAIDRVLQAR
ncbi:hypothetical protein E3C22_01465 [Jiella endophytica]|uniref:Uncharacterized protein n=1 Tax=Jiella endophytica TaxID=2558362 RepID=A0A4Y8RSB1_9HYPH|nr:hypothetical protein [Jiella endophytica]TFF27175.1 hypothetical protein E3C22_01465 [Jiella endophytica]